MKMEKNMLEFSAIGGLFFAVFGLVWGIISKSSMIMFDGLYSLISLFLSIASIFITNYMAKSDYKRFPFGKGVLEPIAVSLKSIVLIIMCSITFFDAIQTIISGGSSVDTNLALGYSIVSTAVCIFIYVIVSKNSKRISSDILKAESSQWLMDTMLCIAVFVGFILCLVLNMTRFGWLTGYVDSAMVIITSFIFIKVPIASLMESFKEITNGNANKEINEEIYTIVKSIEQEYKFEDSITRVSKIGRELRIEIDFVFNEDSSLEDLNEMDYVRETIFKKMDNIKLKKWLNINFTGDKKWAI